MHQASAVADGGDRSATPASSRMRRGAFSCRQEGMSSDAHELSGVKLTTNAGLEHFRNRVVLAETDSKLTQGYINHLEGRSVFLSSIT